MTVKNIFVWLLSFSVFFSSCSKDEVMQNDNRLPKKVEVYLNNELSQTSTYTYEGNKLLKILNNSGNYSVFKYNKNKLIIEISYYDYLNNLLIKTTYDYIGSQLVTTVRYDYSDRTALRTDYVKNQDGSVKGFKAEGDFQFQSSAIGYDLLKFDAQGNIVEISKHDTSDEVFEKYVYTFDDKLNPFSQIYGYKEIYSNLGNKNNILSSKIYTRYNVLLFYDSRVYEYDSNNNPLTFQITTQKGEQNKVNYIY